MKAGWEEKRIGDVIEHLRTGLNPRTHFKLNTPDAEGYYITVRELKGFAIEPDEKTDKVNRAAIKRINERSNLKIGDVLFSGTGTIGKTALVSELPVNWNIKEGVYAMTPKHSELNSKYFIYYIGSDLFLRLVNDKAAGTGVRSIPMKELVKLPISIPSLSEQQSIVDRLDSAFAKIDTMKANAEKALNEAKALFQASLKEMLEPKEGWVTSTLKDECYKITDGTHQTPKYYPSGYIFLSSRNVTSRKIDWEDVKFIDESQHQLMYKRVAPQVGDILLAKNGTTGVAAMVDRDVVFDIYVSLALLRSRGNVTPEYLLAFVNSPIAKEQFDKRLIGMGVPNLHLGEINQVVITYPQDKVEQIRMTQRIEELDSLIIRLQENYDKISQECDALKQAILRQVFE